jgi:hypothetical protein
MDGLLGGDDTSAYGMAPKRSLIVRSGMMTCSWLTAIRSESCAMAAV